MATESISTAAASRTAHALAPQRAQERERPSAPADEAAPDSVRISAQAQQLAAQRPPQETGTEAPADDANAQRSAELRRAYNVQS